MLYFKMKRFPFYITFSSGSSYSTAFNSWSFCDRSKLFAFFEWSVNCLSETCHFNLIVRGDRDSRATLMPIYGDLYQIKL